MTSTVAVATSLHANTVAQQKPRHRTTKGRSTVPEQSLIALCGYQIEIAGPQPDYFSAAGVVLQCG
jgi:hypothetical protein